MQNCVIKRQPLQAPQARRRPMSLSRNFGSQVSIFAFSTFRNSVLETLVLPSFSSHCFGRSFSAPFHNFFFGTIPTHNHQRAASSSSSLEPSSFFFKQRLLAILLSSFRSSILIKDALPSPPFATHNTPSFQQPPSRSLPVSICHTGIVTTHPLRPSLHDCFGAVRVLDAVCIAHIRSTHTLTFPHTTLKFPNPRFQQSTFAHDPLFFSLLCSTQHIHYILRSFSTNRPFLSSLAPFLCSPSKFTLYSVTNQALQKNPIKLHQLHTLDRPLTHSYDNGLGSAARRHIESCALLSLLTAVSQDLCKPGASGSLHLREQ